MLRAALISQFQGARSMSELQTIRRVTVYADAHLEADLTQQFLKLGAKGYTVTACRGKGKHDSVEDLFAPTGRVRIEILVQPLVGDRIMEYMSGNQFKRLAVAACMESVQVAMDDHF